MEEEFSVYRKFSSTRQALEVQVLLNEYGIESELGNNAPPVDISFSGSTVMNQTEIRIREADFERADDILEKNAEKLLQDIDPDYYLFDFTDEELSEIILKPDEWNEFDYLLAQNLLKHRGKPVSEEMIKSIREDRLKQLSQPEKSQKSWIAIGYILALLGGIFGIFIGFLLWKSKTTLPNGKKVFAYSEGDRKHGRNILLIGVLVLPFAVAWRITSMS